jgi:hypothetical protein
VKVRLQNLDAVAAQFRHFDEGGARIERIASTTGRAAA